MPYKGQPLNKHIQLLIYFEKIQREKLHIGNVSSEYMAI